MNETVTHNETKDTLKKLLDILPGHTANEYRKWRKEDEQSKIYQAIEKHSDFKHMMDCRDGGPACGSIYCMKCRDKKIGELNKSFLSYYKSRFGGVEYKARRRLKYGTVLHEIIPIRHYTLVDEQASIQDLKLSVKRLKDNLLKINRKLRDGIFLPKKGRTKKNIMLLGSIHIELIDLDLYREIDKPNGETPKQKVFNEWFYKGSIEDYHQYYFVVHTHFIIDDDGLTGDELGELFRSIKEWNITTRQVQFKKLTDRYGDGPRHKITDAFRNIAAYGYNGSNAALRFTTTWGDSRSKYVCKEEKEGLYNLKMVAYREDSRPEVDKDLSVGQIRTLVLAHNLFTDGGRNDLKVWIKRLERKDMDRSGRTNTLPI